MWLHLGRSDYVEGVCVCGGGHEAVSGDYYVNLKLLNKLTFSPCAGCLSELLTWKPSLCRYSLLNGANASDYVVMIKTHVWL